MKNSTLKLLWIITLVIMFSGALAVRLVDFDDPPLDFHPARQLHSALMARAFYQQSGGTLDGFSDVYSHESLSRGLKEKWIEPPIFEELTGLLYHLSGGPDLGVPRICSIVFWLLGAIGLLKLCNRFIGRAGLLAALAFFLYFPYCILASRSFQPDPLMVALMLWALELICHWSDKPESAGRAIAAGLLTGLAVLVKQVAAFPLGLAIGAYLIGKYGLRAILKNRYVWLIGALSLLPMIAYNVWGYFIDGFLVQQYQGRFFLSELISPAFYVRWFRMIDKVFTIPLFAAALIGIFAIRSREFRLLWVGFLIGYVCYGWCLPHHIGTHDYYQLLLFPLIAAGLGACFNMVMRRLQSFDSMRKFSEAGMLLVLLFLCLWWSTDSVMTLHRHDYREWPQRWMDLAVELEPYEDRISTIGVMDDYGAGMIYWGLRTPMVWESNVESVSEYDALVTLNTTFWNYQFVVITDLESFYQQPRLQRYLLENATLYREGTDYIIYDLREQD